MSATVINPSAQNNTVASATFAPTVTATTIGNAYIVGVALVTKTRTISGIAAGAQNFVHLAGGGSSTAGFADLWWLPTITSSFTTYTITLTGGLTSKFQVGMFEVGGLAGTTDGTPSTTNHTTAATTAAETMTTVTGNDFLVSGFGAGTGATSTNSPFTINASTAGSGAGLAFALATAEVATPGSVTCTWNSTSEVSTTALAAFSESLPHRPNIIARLPNMQLPHARFPMSAG